MSAIEQNMFVEIDRESNLVFFYCGTCPLTIPFMYMRNAYIYLEGHKLNAYHKRRLELQQ